MIPRYTSTAMSSVWSDDFKYTNWLNIEKAIINYFVNNNKYPISVANVINSISIDNILIDKIKIREKEIKHDVLAFVEVICDALENRSIGSSSYFHRGLTSSDIVDTAFAIQITKAHGLIMSALFGLISIVEKLYNDYKHVDIVGRTHGQWAEPITIGL